MKLIIISTKGKLTDETKIVTRLFESGLETFHLRKVHFSTKALGNYIKEIPEVFHSRIVLHTHHNLAYKYNVKGIHLGKYHRKNKIRTWIKLRILYMKRPNMIVTTSFNKLQPLYENDSKYDYVFLAPIFDSLSGKYQSGYTEHALREAQKKTMYKVIARGGICMDVIPKVSELGFEGLAFYTDIWNKKDPVNEFIKILDEMKRLGIEKS